MKPLPRGLKEFLAYGDFMKLGEIFFLIILITLLSFSQAANAEADYTVGLSPNSIDLGVIERGSSHLVTFKVLTPSTEPLLVSLDSYEADITTLKPEPNNFSEETCSGWAYFIKNPVTITPSGQSRSYSTVDLMLNIPFNAEPGYHRIIIKPSVFVPDQATGMVGSAVVGVTTFSLSFFVKGSAMRSGTLLDSVKTGYSDNGIEMSTYFQNNGTVTVLAKITQKTGDKSVVSDTQKVLPQEIKVFKTYLQLEGFEKGKTYPLETIANYGTGMAVLDSNLSITEDIPVRQVPGQGFPWIIILAIFAVSAIIAYWYSKKA
jgi:hypothetical protein